MFIVVYAIILLAWWYVGGKEMLHYHIV